MYYKNIEGHFNFEKVYDKVLSETQNGDILVEIGTYLGKSTCYMAERVKEMGLKVVYHTIDTFAPDPGMDMSRRRKRAIIAEGGDIYNSFLENMRKANVLGLIIVHRMRSTDAATLFADDSLSFVFIDGAHIYESVKEDIKVWYPKVKVGSLFGGHDYGNRIPTGVDRAVPERFGSDFEVIENSWIHRRK